MRILLQSPRIVNTLSPFHLKKKNVLIVNGRITEIGDKNYQADKTIDADGMILSAGWFDMGTFLGDPGLEHRENISTLIKAASAGGFTEVAVIISNFVVWSKPHTLGMQIRLDSGEYSLHLS